MINAAIPVKACASPLSLGALAKGGEGPVSPGEIGPDDGEEALFGSLLVALATLQAAPAQIPTAVQTEASVAALPESHGKTGKILPPVLPPLPSTAQPAVGEMAMPIREIVDLAKSMGGSIGKPATTRLVETAGTVALQPASSRNSPDHEMPAPSPRQMLEMLAARPTRIATSAEAVNVSPQAAVLAAVVEAQQPAPAPASTKAMSDSEPAAAPQVRAHPAIPLPDALDKTPTAQQQPVSVFPLGQPQAHAPTPLPTPSIAADAAPIAAERFGELVEAIAQARETGSSHAIRATVSHAEFGVIALKLASDDSGVSAIMSSADADFAPAVQASASAGRSGQEPGQSMAQQNPQQMTQQGFGQSNSGQSQANQSQANMAQSGTGQSGLGQSGQSPSGQPSAQQHRAAAIAPVSPSSEAPAAADQVTGPSQARRGILA